MNPPIKTRENRRDGNRFIRDIWPVWNWFAHNPEETAEAALLTASSPAVDGYLNLVDNLGLDKGLSLNSEKRAAEYAWWFAGLGWALFYARTDSE